MPNCAHTGNLSSVGADPCVRLRKRRSDVGRESKAHTVFCIWDDTLSGLDLTTYPEKVNLIRYQVTIKKSAGAILKLPPPKADFDQQVISAPSALPVIIAAFGK